MEQKSGSKRPEDSNFKQQRLKAWQPLLTPPWVIGTFIGVAIVFIPIGIAILVSSGRVVEVRQRYDELCSNIPVCVVNITIPQDMKGPIYFYYELSNYYQNHRRYVKSRSDAQLRGSLTTGLSDCAPADYNVNGSAIVPCGLIANSFFNDTFNAWRCDSTLASCQNLNNTDSWVRKDISWKSDREQKFKYKELVTGTSNVGLYDVSLPRVDNEDLIVWMRTAGLPRFKKLYSKMYTDFNSGEVVSVTITNTYPVASFNGQKAIVLSMTSWLGGKNSFLGYAYVVVGAVCFFLAMAFWAKHAYTPRRLGDIQYFHWSGAGGSKPADSGDDDS